MKKKSWAIALIILAALAGVSASRVFTPFDTIKENEKTNIEQAKDIEQLKETDEDLNETMKDGFDRLQKSQETYFEILNDKIDYSRKQLQ